MTYDANKETIDRYVKALDKRIDTVDEMIWKKQIEREALNQQRSVLRKIIKDTAPLPSKSTNG